RGLPLDREPELPEPHGCRGRDLSRLRRDGRRLRARRGDHGARRRGVKITGRAICVPADVDTDLIIAGRYLRTRDRSLWAAHAFEDLDRTLAGRLAGAVVVAGPNFGCGSSREQAAIALREAGVKAV